MAAPRLQGGNDTVSVTLLCSGPQERHHVRGRDQRPALVKVLLRSYSCGADSAYAAAPESGQQRSPPGAPMTSWSLRCVVAAGQVTPAFTRRPAFHRRDAAGEKREHASVALPSLRDSPGRYHTWCVYLSLARVPDAAADPPLSPAARPGRRARPANMATFAAEVKLFGKWSFEDVEVRSNTLRRSPARVAERTLAGRQRRRCGSNQTALHAQRAASLACRFVRASWAPCLAHWTCGLAQRSWRERWGDQP